MKNPLQYLTAALSKGAQEKKRREQAVLGATPTSGAELQVPPSHDPLVGEIHRPGAEMSIWDHISELRKHIMRMVYWYFGLTGVLFCFMQKIMFWLRKPYVDWHEAHHVAQKLVSLGVFEAMTVHFKMIMLLGFVVAVPFFLREVWGYVAPALYPHERRYVRPFLAASVGLFYSGVVFGYFVILPMFLNNSLDWAREYQVDVMLTTENYYDFITNMVVVFGVIFEVPVVMTLLGMAGIVSSQLLLKNRRVVILASFILGALISPPDVYSQVTVALPIWAMVELSILSLKWIERNRAKKLASNGG